MFFKCVFIDAQLEAFIETAEEHFPFLIRLRDNDSILITKVPDIGKGGAEHGVSRYKPFPEALVVFVEAGFY